MEIIVQENPHYGNVFVFDLNKLWPKRKYSPGTYHAVCQEWIPEKFGKEGWWRNMPGPIWNSWGSKDKIIAKEHEKKAHSRYGVMIKSLTLKAYDRDFSIMKYEFSSYCRREAIVFIYFNDAVRKEHFANEDFRYLCDTMGLDINGNLVKKLPKDAIV